MVQVVTVSAHTAAYAAEAAPRPARTSRKSHVEDSMKAVVNNAADGDDAWTNGPANIVQASTLSLDFLSANQSRHQSAPLREIIDAYGDNSD